MKDCLVSIARYTIIAFFLLGLAGQWACQSPEQGAVDGLANTAHLQADGQTVLTEQLQALIDTLHNSGGGTLRFPAGDYLSGTLYLKSNVELHLEPGARLLGSPQLSDYPENPMNIGTRTAYYSKRALIWADGQENIAITGQGTLDANSENYQGHEKSILGLRFISCKQVTVRDVELRDGTHWMQHYLACEEVVIDGVRVFNHHHHTNDGMNIDGCKNVRISNCYIDSHDDALALKSSGPARCENITITNNILRSHCHTLKFGTETTGGFSRVNISNCVMQASDVPKEGVEGRLPAISAISLEITDGGTMEDITMMNCTGEHLFAPIFIKLGNRARKHTDADSVPKPGVGTLKNITIAGLRVKDAGPFSSSITGFPGHDVEDVLLRDIYIEHKGGGKASEILDTVPENEADYPEFSMFGNDWHQGPRLPSYGLFVRHVKGLRMNNVHFRLKQPDARKALYTEDVQGLSKNAVFARKPGEPSRPL